MTGWVALIINVVLLYAQFGVCDVGGFHYNATDFPRPLSNGSYLLTDLIKKLILDVPGNNCSASVLNGGFLNLKNHTWSTTENFTVRNPNLFVTCLDEAGDTRDYSDLLKKFSSTVNSLTVIDDSRRFLGKDNFQDSILMVAFMSCAICVGMWMVYLVLLFQRCPTHAGRRTLLVVYVLFAAIYETVNLNLAVQKIFKKQYRGNYQDTTEYEMVIIESQKYRVGEIITNALACLNWVSIIYYMFQNCNRIHKNWLPNMVANRNRIIVWTGIAYTILEEIIFSILLWHRWSMGLCVTYMFLELCFYSVFYGLIGYFVYYEFGFILLPRQFTTNNKSRIKHVLKSLWNDYHQILLVLIYNFSVFVLLFFTRIYFAFIVTADNKWKYKVIKFFKLVVTVSIWGLITVLEKRDSIVSKETVLGRKIKNSDRFFYDIHMFKDDNKSALSTINSTYDASDLSLQITSWGSNNTVRGESGSSSIVGNVWKLLRFKLPTKTWDSRLKRSKGYTNGILGTREKFQNILAGTNKRRGNEGLKIFKHAVSTGEEETNISDDTSVETELATNYIYDLQHNNGI